MPNVCYQDILICNKYTYEIEVAILIVQNTLFLNKQQP